jgi:hypothetical protein
MVATRERERRASGPRVVSSVEQTLVGARPVFDHATLTQRACVCTKRTRRPLNQQIRIERAWEQRKNKPFYLLLLRKQHSSTRPLDIIDDDENKQPHIRVGGRGPSSHLAPAICTKRT